MGNFFTCIGFRQDPYSRQEAAPLTFLPPGHRQQTDLVLQIPDKAPADLKALFLKGQKHKHFFSVLLSLSHVHVTKQLGQWGPAAVYENPPNLKIMLVILIREQNTK
jgi:hypothetical protein